MTHFPPWRLSLTQPSYLANFLTIRQYQLFSDPSSGSEGGLHNALWSWHHSSYIVILPVYVPVSPPGVWVPLIAFSFLYPQNLAGYLTHWRCGHKCLLIEWMLNFTCEDGGEGVGKGFTALINLFKCYQYSHCLRLSMNGEINLDEIDSWLCGVVIDLLTKYVTFRNILQLTI